MKLSSAVELQGVAGTNPNSSSQTGRKWYVVSKNYGQSPAARFPTRRDGRIFSGPYDTYEEAAKASAAAPYTRVSSQPRLEETPAVRDIVRQRRVRTNPDVDGVGTSEGAEKGWDERGRGQGMETKPGLKDIKKLIDEKKAKIEDLKQNGTKRMSKQGVRWASQTLRQELKRLNDWYKREKAGSET